MCRFIETIRVDSGTVNNLDYHLRRANLTRQQFFKGARPLRESDFHRVINPKTKLAKLRFEYDGNAIYNLTAEPYVMRQVQSLRIVADKNIVYPYKCADRTLLNQLREQRGTCDDIVIVKRGNITDTSYTNIAFFDGKEWLTPDTPLLPGTRRKSLIDNGKLREARITLADLPHFKRLALINAMIGLGELSAPYHMEEDTAGLKIVLE